MHQRSMKNFKNFLYQLVIIFLFFIFCMEVKIETLFFFFQEWDKVS